MDAAEYGEAVERLEQEYLAGGMSADEYTRRRRELERAAAGDRGAEAPPTREPIRPAPPAPSLTGGTVDPVTGASLASWGRRAGGLSLDGLVYVGALVAVIALATLSAAGSETGEIRDPVAGLVVLVWFLGPTLYAWLMVGRFGQTLGKMAVGIRVVQGGDGGRVSYSRALARALSTWVLGLLALPLLLAYLWPLWDRRNQTLYDKLVGTIVVRGVREDFGAA